MMAAEVKRAALVLSGGGAKGAFQYAVAEVLHQQGGYEWTQIAGVSVGALNGALLAMGDYELGREIWETVEPGRVYRGNMSTLSVLWRTVLGKESVLDNQPLQDLLDEYYDHDAVQIPFQVGAVSLTSGTYTAFKHTDYPAEQFKKAIIASTVMPIVWAAIDIPGKPEFVYMVDGGVRNVSPLGDVLDDDPEMVVVINCSSDKPQALEAPPKGILNVALRSLTDIAINELLLTDVREFLRINELVKQAGEQGMILYKDLERTKPFKYFEALVIQPDKPLDDTLDFSRAAIQRSLEAGRRKAEEVLAIDPEFVNLEAMQHTA